MFDVGIWLVGWCINSDLISFCFLCGVFGMYIDSYLWCLFMVLFVEFEFIEWEVLVSLVFFFFSGLNFYMFEIGLFYFLKVL